MKVYKLLFLFFMIALAIPFKVQAQAQDTPTRFERISIEQGLSQVTIYCILQDSQGWMWFGTEDGLNRYDGYNFAIYKRDPADLSSLSDNTVKAIYEDWSGVLWIGSDGGGLNRYDRSTEKFTSFRNDPTNPHSLSHDTVTVIYEDSSGTMWIGTDGGGLNRLDRETGEFTRLQSDSNNPASLSNDSVTSILEDSSGGLWIGTMGGGLNRLDQVTGQFTHYRNDPDDPTSLSLDDVTSMVESQTGELWIGTYGGLNRFDPQSQKFSRYFQDSKEPDSLVSNEVETLFEDSSGALWVGTPDGLDEMEPDTGKFNHYRNDPQDPTSLSLDDINVIYEDDSNVLWIGTEVAGLNKLDRKTRRFAHYKSDSNNSNSLTSNMIWAIHEDEAGKLWIGSSGSPGGLDLLDRSESAASSGIKFTHYQLDREDPTSLNSDTVLAVYEDSGGVLWVGTYNGGLNRLDRQTGEFTHYLNDPDDPNSLSNDIVWGILEDSTEALWVGTFGGGLNRLDRETGKFAHYPYDPEDPHSLYGDLILYLYEDREGTLWVGTNMGLNKFDRQTEQFTHYKNDPLDPSSLSSNAIPAIYQDSSGRLWVGTDDGLNRFEAEKGIFVHYTEKDGLINDAIACILEDDQRKLWISSGKGVSRLDPQTGEFKNYDSRDGLQSDEFNRGACDKGKGGILYFGGVNGVSAFDPVKITDNTHLPPVVITGFRVFNQPVMPGKNSPLEKSISETEEIRLSYQDYVFSFEFAALDYTIPNKNNYAYCLEGFDKDWNYVDSTRRFATYANLPAGSYTFKVKGSNNDGIWNEEGKSIQVTITPPPWKTWWAYTLYALIAAAILAVFLRYRMKEIERKHLEQTMWAVQKERDRIASLLESRRQLVVTLSHDLRTPVAVMRGHLESALAEGKDQSQPILHSLEVMSQEVERLQSLLEDLFTLSRLEVDKLAFSAEVIEVTGVARNSIEAIAGPAWKQNKVEVSLEVEEGELWALADEQRLMQVLMNLLHNAVRHTLPGGIVVVNLSDEPEAVVIKVRDTGEGIHPDDLPHIWDRFYRGRSQAGGGTGLGLALVKELTEAMGGVVGVESVLGEGSCFTISLPRSDKKSPV